MKTLLAPLLASLLLLGPAAHAQQVQPLERIAAVVDEDVILQSELDRAVANILVQYGNTPEQLPPRDILERQVLERLILVRLQAERAASSGVRVDDAEVDAAITGIAQQNNMTPDQLRAQIARDGLSFADFRNTLREELMIQRLQQRFAQGRVVVSDGEVDAALQAQTGGAQYRLAHILVALPDGATSEQIGLAEEKVEGIQALVERNEMEFSAAAVRYSDSPNALEGGDLGWRSLDEIPAAFSSAVRNMQPGQMIGPIRGPSGYQLLQLVDVRDGAAAGTSTQYQARHILIRVDGATEADAAHARIQALHAQATAGADFAALAGEHSEDTFSRERGGDLGWFDAGQFGPDFGEQVAGLSDGAVSAPFRTQAGWHIVQRTGSRQAAANDENRRAMVRESIGQRKFEEEWERFSRELRSEAFVDIRTAGSSAAPQL